MRSLIGRELCGGPQSGITKKNKKAACSHVSRPFMAGFGSGLGSWLGLGLRLGLGLGLGSGLGLRPYFHPTRSAFRSQMRIDHRPKNPGGRQVSSSRENSEKKKILAAILANIGLGISQADLGLDTAQFRVLHTHRSTKSTTAVNSEGGELGALTSFWCTTLTLRPVICGGRRSGFCSKHI